MELNVWDLIRNADIVVKFVLLCLVIQSIFSWAIIFQKRRVLQRAKKESKEFLDLFWSQKNMEVAYRRVEEMEFCPVGKVFRSGFQELARIRENKEEGRKLSEDEIQGLLGSVERALRRKITDQLTFLEKRVTFLATTGSSAPFIGLFGTVWGIMNSFMNIAKKGATNLAVVAPGISEALIATALGLFAAIPAVIGYNYCNSQIRYIHREMDNFASDFLNVIKHQMGAQ